MFNKHGHIVENNMDREFVQENTWYWWKVGFLAQLMPIILQLH